MHEGLRALSVDAIKAVEMLDHSAKAVAQARLDAVLGSGYGMFSGEAVQWATLLFSAERAKLVKDECWHAEQNGRLLEDWRYELQVPFADDRELQMDILKYGADCVCSRPNTCGNESWKRRGRLLSGMAHERLTFPAESSMVFPNC